MNSLRKAKLKIGKGVARLAVNVAKQAGTIEEGIDTPDEMLRTNLDSYFRPSAPDRGEPLDSEFNER